MVIPCLWHLGLLRVMKRAIAGSAIKPRTASERNVENTSTVSIWHHMEVFVWGC